MKTNFLRSLPLLAVVLAAAPLAAQTGNIAVNNDGRKPAASAILDVSSNYTPVGVAIQKGMFIPRMTAAQRTTLAGTATQGLVVYQTDAPTGFYYAQYGMWTRIDMGSNAWDIFGNNPATSSADYLGTTDDRDFVFKTNSAEVMRLKGTAGARYLGIGTTTPAEMVDVNGAIRIYNPAPGSYTGTNNPTNYAATNQAGVVLYRPSTDTLFATYTPPGQSADALMWAGHWGNVNGTGPAGLATATANPGGWTKMENDYEERFTKTYSQQGQPNAPSAGSVQIPNGVSTAVTANFTNGVGSPLTAFQQRMVSPYPHTTSARIRHQHMFLASELNVESYQLSNPPSTLTATGGLCANQPITSLAIYIGTIAGFTGAVQPTPAGPGQKTTTPFIITVKHAALGVNNLSTGFDNSVDPGQACYTQAGATNRPSLQNGWETFAPLGPSFVWDGVRNIIVEIVYGTTPVAAAIVPPVLFAPTPGGALLTASWNSTSTLAPCSVVGFAGSCTAAAAPGGMPWANASCGVLNTDGGTVAYRPVIQFTGTVCTSSAGVAGTNSYLFYRGGLVIESTTSPAPWGRQITPYYTFRGPGTISVENGVWDNTVRLNDHVFDRAFDGRVKEQDAENHGRERNLGIGEMSSFTKSYRHLPTMKGRDQWNAEGGFSLGDLTNQLWTTSETQALYVTELNDKLDVLELLSNDRPLDQAEYELAKKTLCAMTQYTESEKAALLSSLAKRTVTTNQR